MKRKSAFKQREARYKAIEAAAVTLRSLTRQEWQILSLGTKDRLLTAVIEVLTLAEHHLVRPAPGKENSNANEDSNA